MTLDSVASGLRWRRNCAVADQGERGQVLGVCVGGGVEVLLGGLDVGMSEAFHDGGEVGAAGEQPGGVGVAQVVDPNREVDPVRLNRRKPDPGKKGVARDRGTCLSREEKVVVPDPLGLDVFGDFSSQAWRTPKVRGSLSLGWGLSR